MFCSIPRLFVCLRMRMSASQQYANVYVKSIFICPGSIAGVPFDSARRFRPTLLLHTTCVRSCCTWRANCVAAFQKKKVRPLLFFFSFSSWQKLFDRKKKFHVFAQFVRFTMLLRFTCCPQGKPRGLPHAGSLESFEVEIVAEIFTNTDKVTIDLVK